jgi:transglutaminase-like putative cysteine protease
VTINGLQPAGPGPDARETGVTTAALAVLTLVTAAGLGRLFQGDTWAGPVLVAAATTHLACWIGRRLRLANAVATPVALAVGVLVTVWWVVPGTTVYGLPLARTWTTVGHDLAAAHRAFATVVAPTPAVPGFVLAAGAGAALMAVLADWAAFRLDSALEAVVPALATVILVAVLVNDSHPTLWMAGFVAASGLFLASHEADRRSRSPARFTGGTGRRRTVTQAAVLLSAAAAFGGVVFGPRLPGAHASGVVTIRPADRGGPTRRTTISPLVDIRSRLIQESTTELFTVTASAPAYWRLTSLDRFDGNIWSSDDPYSPIGSRVPTARSVGGATALTQRYVIGSLGSIWLPAAYLPSSITGPDGVSWDAESDSLISRSATSDGQGYTIVSERPDLSPGLLGTATDSASNISPADLARYTQLPPGIPANVVALAHRATAGATDPYVRALDLQNYLRDHYTYSLDVPAGHSTSALESFLFETRKGYCEQFAGAFAVMARVLGLPTRVAVGFTPGQLESDGKWHVLGADAHAWPEVELAPFGWVAFEPTPGRGMPGAQAYTGVAPAQASPAGVATAPSTTVAGPAPVAASRRPQQVAVGGGAAGSHRSAPVRSGGAGAPLVALLGLAGAALAWAVAVPTGKSWRRHRRRRRARGEADRVLVSWAEANERLAASGLARGPAETLREHAARSARSGSLGPEAADALAALAAQAEAAAYGPRSGSEGAARLAGRRAAQVEHAVLRAAGRWRRVAWGLDPRVNRA